MCVFFRSVVIVPLVTPTLIFLAETLFWLSERGQKKVLVCFYLKLNLFGHSWRDCLVSQADASACLWGHQQCENPPRRPENKPLTAEVAT